MSRRIKDVVPTVIALVVLCGLLIAISPRLHERVAEVAAHPEWDALGGRVMHIAMSGMTMVHGYADVHTYLFTFLVAACVFVVLMLKVIS